MNDLENRLDAFEKAIEEDIAAGQKYHDELRGGGAATSATLIVKGEIKGAEVTLHRFRAIVRGQA